MVILSIHRQRNTACKHSSVAKVKLCSRALVLRMSLVSMFACLPLASCHTKEKWGKMGRKEGKKLV